MKVPQGRLQSTLLIDQRTNSRAPRVWRATSMSLRARQNRNGNKRSDKQHVSKHQQHPHEVRAGASDREAQDHGDDSFHGAVGG